MLSALPILLFTYWVPHLQNCHILVRVIWHNRLICDNHIHINRRCCHSNVFMDINSGITRTRLICPDCSNRHSRTFQYPPGQILLIKWNKLTNINLTIIPSSPRFRPTILSTNKILMLVCCYFLIYKGTLFGIKAL